MAVVVHAHGGATGAQTGTVREVAGGRDGLTAAECVAVRCYFLCAVAEFVVLMVMRVPTVVTEV